MTAHGLWVCESMLTATSESNIFFLYIIILKMRKLVVCDGSLKWNVTQNNLNFLLLPLMTINTRAFAPDKTNNDKRKVSSPRSLFSLIKWESAKLVKISCVWLMDVGMKQWQVLVCVNLSLVFSNWHWNISNTGQKGRLKLAKISLK